MPGLTIAGSLFKSLANVNHRLLQYWLEKASQIMVVDPNINPFSFGILELLESSQSLVHSIQSISLGHENFYGSSSVVDCLQERAHALLLVQEELQGSNQAALRGSLLTVLLLGVSTPWVLHQTQDDFGQEHLNGARAILDILLATPGATQDSIVRVGVATYLFWDQATAFLPQFGNQLSSSNTNILECVQSMRCDYNPIVGYSIEVMYLLADLGHYCRNTMDGMPRDVDVEASFEEQLFAWEPAGTDHISCLVNDSFKKHGLIMLYRTTQSSAMVMPLEATYDGCFDHEGLIQQYARDILLNLEAIPESSQYHCILAQPLFTAGSEISTLHSREQVCERFRNLFSMTRIPALLRAVALLDELWSLHDTGCKIFWMAYLLQKEQIFALC